VTTLYYARLAFLAVLVILAASLLALAFRERK
jgi:HAMP domain-containing protein